MGQGRHTLRSISDPVSVYPLELRRVRRKTVLYCVLQMCTVISTLRVCGFMLR